MIPASLRWTALLTTSTAFCATSCPAGARKLRTLDAESDVARAFSPAQFRKPRIGKSGVKNGQRKLTGHTSLASNLHPLANSRRSSDASVRTTMARPTTLGTSRGRTRALAGTLADIAAASMPSSPDHRCRVVRSHSPVKLDPPIANDGKAHRPTLPLFG